MNAAQEILCHDRLAAIYAEVSQKLHSPYHLCDASITISAALDSFLCSHEPSLTEDQMQHFLPSSIEKNTIFCNYHDLFAVSSIYNVQYYLE